MAAGVEHGVKGVWIDISQPHRRRQRRLRFGICLEAAGVTGLRVGRIAFGVKRGMATLGRGQRDRRPSVQQDEIGGGELLEPETRFEAGLSKSIMRCQHDQNIHVVGSLGVAGPTRITRLPKFSPRSSPMKAEGACSSPSMISSR